MNPCRYSKRIVSGIHPAVIAAIASRESRGGKLLKRTKGWGDKNVTRCGDCQKCSVDTKYYCGYGILQCDIKTSGLNESGCTNYSWDSCEHLDMMVKRVLVKMLEAVKSKHKNNAAKWPPEKLLQGGIAAYNFGSKNVLNPDHRLDIGTHNHDYSNDVVARAQHLITKYGWGKSGTGVFGLKDLAESGNCDFFSSAETQKISCGSEGYLIGHGYRICKRLSGFRNLFTPHGQLRIDLIQKCLMTKLYQYLENPGKSCETVKETGFAFQRECYHPEICIAALDSQNIEALCKVYEGIQLGEDGEFAIQQILEALRSCTHQHLSSFVTDVKETVGEIKQKISLATTHTCFKNIRSQKSETLKQEAISGTCETYAAVGDCRFYECFTLRFPCKSTLGVSHMIDFELLNCNRIKTAARILHTEGTLFFEKFQLCLMKELSGYYRRNEVDCFETVDAAHAVRRHCLVEAGICYLKNVDFMFDMVKNLHGYPYLVPVANLWNHLYLDGIDKPVTNYYYRQATVFDEQIADAQCACRAERDGVCRPKCSLVYNQYITGWHCVHDRSSDHKTVQGDPKCTASGGTCKITSPLNCLGVFEKGRCKGANNRQCCVPRTNVQDM